METRKGREHMTDSAWLKEIKSHMDHGRWEAAESCCRRWLTDVPDDVEAQKRLGIALYFQQKWPASAEVLKKCVAQCPGDNEALHWLIAACRDGYDTAGAYEAACKLRQHPFMPDDELMVYHAFEDACAWRDAGKVQKHVLALARQGKITVEQYPYLMVLLNHVPGISPAVMYDIHRVWGDSIMRGANGIRLAEESPPPSPGEHLKIAYLSADFREHPIGKFMRTIFASHDHHRFEIYCYVEMLADDAITDEIRLASDHFIDISKLDDEALARRIHADGIHILIEIGSHMAHSRLAALAWKPAPVQITYLAEPNTTGLPAMDFRITDANSEAAGGTRYVEKQLNMPESFLCMGDLPDFERTTATPAENNGYVTFASFNGVRKFNPGVIAVWCKILKRVKGARLVIKSPGTSVPIVRANLLKEFKRRGIVEERLEFVEYCTFQEHADWHNKVDIALDSFPYNGTTTTFDTLWMGVPVVTLVGELHAQRTSYTILKNIGFDEAAAAFSEKEYVDKAVHLAEHPETLSFLRRCLPAMIRHSILFQPERFTAQLEDLYIRAWEEKMGAWKRTPDFGSEETIIADHGDAGQTDIKEIKRIFIAGMPRSGVAWIYRAVESITRAMGQSSALSPQHSELTPQPSPPHIQFLHAPAGEALKVVQSGDAVLIYARRDPRDVAVALMDIHGISFDVVMESGRLPNLIEDDKTWENIPRAHAVRYENIVDDPARVIKHLGACLGYEISDEDAESIVFRCRQAPAVDDVQKPGESDPSGTQTERPEHASTEFSADPPGIHRDRLELEQAGRLNLACREWLEKCFYVQPLYPAAGEDKAIHICLRDDIRMCLPATLAQRSTYILLEQEEWFEPEIRFLRKWIAPGMRCADIGAGFGCFALVMSRLAGAGGRVWALEPSDMMADMLHRSIELNGFDHCRLMRLAASDRCGDAYVCFEDGGETSILADSPGGQVQMAVTGLIDEIAAKHGWRGLDFIRINAGDRAGDALEGGECFLRENSPLIMIANASENINALQWLGRLDYTPYRLISGLNALMPIDADAPDSETPHDLFFCKKDRAKALSQSGRLIQAGMLKQAVHAPKENYLPDLLSRFPYAKKFEAIWSAADRSRMPGSGEYGSVLNMVAAAWGEKTPVQKRMLWLRNALIALTNLVEAYANLPRLLTLARVAIDLGETETARQTLDGVIEHLQAGNTFVPEEPFLAASSWAEAMDPGEHPAEWCLAQAIHARLKYCEPSSWYTKASDIHLLEAFRQCGFSNPEMERRRQLVLMRCGLITAPEALPQPEKAAPPDNLNPDFWQGKPALTSNPLWESSRSLNTSPWLCSFPKSGNTMTRIVLEHYFQRPVPSVYASDASILFNSGREHAVAVKCHYMRDVRPGNKLIYIHRDPRDVLISLFKWNHKKLCTEAPAEFTSFITGAVRSWKSEVEEALAWIGPKLIVGYDDLVERPREIYVKILTFLDDMPVDSLRLEASIAAATKGKVADALTDFGTVAKQIMPLERKTSRWREMLSPEQSGMIQNAIGAPLMKKLGYALIEGTGRADEAPALSGGIYHDCRTLDGDITSLAREKAKRMKEARRWMDIPRHSIEPALHSDDHVHDGILKSNIRHHAWTTDEAALVEELRCNASRAIEQGDMHTYIKSAMAAMLYCLPHQFPLVTNLAVFPLRFIEKYMEFILTRLEFFHEPGESQQYFKVMSGWLETVAHHIFSSDGAEPWMLVAQHIVQLLYTTPIYMVDGNLRRFYQVRARLFEYYYHKSEWAIDHAMPPRPRDRGKIRIGFIAGHFFPSTETYGTLAIYDHLDRNLFEIQLFALMRDDNEQTHYEQYCLQRADEFIPLRENDVESSVAILRSQDLDIAFFCTNITCVCNPMSLIAMHRIARIQIPYASATTTGLRHADYFVSGTLSEPANSQEQYTERLEFFDGPFLCYSLAGRPLVPEAPAFQRNEIDISEDAIVYISGANFHKILPEVEDAWLRILDRIPESILLLYPLNPFWSMEYPLQAFWERLKRSCARHGIDDARVRIIKPRNNHDDIFRILQCADIYLDSFPFTGATSLIDPLRVSLPPVVMTGNSLRGLFAQSILYDMELHDLVARDADAYVDLAVFLGKDRQLRKRYADKISKAIQENPAVLDTRCYSIKYGEVLKRIAHRHGFFPMMGTGQSLGAISNTTETEETNPMPEGAIS